MRTMKTKPIEFAASTARDWKMIHILAGPLFFFAMLVGPLSSMTYPVRCSLGLLIWVAWWWIARPVNLAVTGLLPLAVVAAFNFVPMTDVLPSYADDLIILLVAANILTAVWHKWGLDRRIALVSLLCVGSSTTRQILVWYSICVVLSAFLPRTVVAATMIPIVIAMLRYLGVDDLWNSKFGTALVLAIAWGSGVGGFLTPLGGAPNLLAMKFVQDQVTRHEFLFVTWLTHNAPLTIAVVLMMLVYIRFGLKPEISETPGTWSYFKDELKKLGPITSHEKWGLGLFVLATVFAFTRQFYASNLPGLTPSFAFLGFAILCFLVRPCGEQLITWEYAQGQLMWGLFYVFAGGTALGAIMDKTGTAKYIAGIILPYAGRGGFAAVLIFTALTLGFAQIISNLATVAIIGPVAIGLFKDLGINPIPYVYIIAAAGHCGFMLPSSAGSSAIAASYGVNLKTMFVKGFWAAAIALLIITVGAYLLMAFWPGFGYA
jgi:solute carrier family 13 (sodium-dependent dicarboxylate transporter), member 2/3/5